MAFWVCRTFAPSGNVTAGGASAAPVRTFDPQGQLASLSIPGSGYGLAFGHDAANRLVSGSSNGAPLVTNAYDWKGRRVRKTTPDATYTLFCIRRFVLMHGSGIKGHVAGVGQGGHAALSRQRGLASMA